MFYRKQHAKTQQQITSTSMKILIVAPNWIGDAIMAEPLYAELKRQHPTLTLDVLAPSWTHPLLKRMTSVDHAIVNPFTHGQLQLKKRWQLARTLKQNQYDQAIILPNSLKSGLIPFFAGIPKRTGYKGEQRYLLLNDIYHLDQSILPRLVDRYLALANPRYRIKSGKTKEEPQIPERNRLDNRGAYPRLHVDPTQKAHTLAKFNLATHSKIAGFCIGAEYGPAKRWPPHHFANLADRLQKQGYQIWLFGSTKENLIADSIKRLATKDTQPSLHNLCGKTSLDEAIDLMSVANVIISNDSGLMHVAAALQRPLIALYGSSSPLYTPPLSDLAEIVTLDLSCSPCFKRECPLGHFNCMQQLTAERVMEAIDRILR